MNEIRSLTLFVAIHCVAAAHAGGINTDAALTPPAGGSILRLQYHYFEKDAAGNIAHVNGSTVRATYVYGFTPKLSFMLSAPYHNVQIDKVHPRFGRDEIAHDGIGDVTLIAKYRFWQLDPAPLHTIRIAALGGMNIRSGDSDFSSDSYDPVLGAVFTWRRDRDAFDADVIYQINTGRGEFRHDTLRYDLAYAYRIFPAVFPESDAWQINGVAELNGRYIADGSHEVFLAPGLQLVTARWVFETSLQLPVIQEFPDNRPETSYRFIIGFRFRW